MRALGPGFVIADWGFAIGSEFWGSGMFAEAAEIVLDFTFDVLGTHRLEARAALGNGRGNGAMKKLGAEREGVLRHAFLREGEGRGSGALVNPPGRLEEAAAGKGPAGLARRPLTSSRYPARFSKRSAARALARAAHSSLSRGAADVTSESISRRATSATSSTAVSNAASFAFEGCVNPDNFRTN